MAKSKDNKLLVLGLLAAGYFLLKKKNTPYNYYQQYPYIPPAPQKNTQAWQQWVATIVQSFGAVANLWAPGGPFYNSGLNQQQAIEIGKGQDYSGMAGIKGFEAKDLLGIIIPMML